MIQSGPGGIVVEAFTGLFSVYESAKDINSGAPNENIVQNHLNIALLNVF